VRGHWLEAKNEARDVVPARQIIRRDDYEAAWSGDPRRLTQKQVCASDVLDDLIRVHEIKLIVRERQRFAEIGIDDINATGNSLLAMTLNELDS
jgi:hypothetical protein